MTNTPCGLKLSAKQFRERVREEDELEAARVATAQLSGLVNMDDLSPRSREVFRTLIDIARRDLEEKNVSKEEVIRRIARDLQRHVEVLSPTGSVQRQAAGVQGRVIQPRPLPIQQFGNVQPQLGGVQGQGQGQGFPMTRVQSSPYPVQFMGFNPSPFPVNVQQWPLQQFPTQATTQIPTSAVQPQLQQQQQQVFTWPWAQMGGNVGTVSHQM
jgi:hypothetical protein